MLTTFIDNLTLRVHNIIILKKSFTNTSYSPLPSFEHVQQLLTYYVQEHHPLQIHSIHQASYFSVANSLMRSSSVTQKHRRTGHPASCSNEAVGQHDEIRVARYNNCNHPLFHFCRQQCRYPLPAMFVAIVTTPFAFATIMHFSGVVWH